MSSHKTILKDIEDFEAKVVRYIKDVARETLVQVVDFSPTPGVADYALGSYVSSHNVSSGSPNEAVTLLTAKDTGAPARAKAKARHLTIDTVKVGTPIYITNGIAYAHIVEYVGWPLGSRGPKGAYHGTAHYAPYAKGAVAGQAYADGTAGMV